MQINDPYTQFSLEEFIWDERFRNDVLKGEERFAYWDNWMKLHPSQQPIVEKARLIVLSIYVKNVYFHEDEIQRIVKDVHMMLDSNHIEETTASTTSIKRNSYKHLFIAASILILSLIGWMWVGKDKAVDFSYKPSYENLIKQVNKKLIERENQTNAPLIITFPDGSKAMLSKSSKISYPENFTSSDKREVFLVGEAYFEVAKNTQKPFFVYADGLVTRVLGTKFRVRSYSLDKEVVVEVTSGKVSVFANPDYLSEDKKESNQLSSIVLVPNQKISYLKSDATIIKTLVNNPIVLIPASEGIISFNFDNTPIFTVFKVLKENYGIDIVFDEELLTDCSLNANLEGYSLYEQLNIICKALNGNYEVLDGRVIIIAKGCLNK
jgi:transmembrane sensor